MSLEGNVAVVALLVSLVALMISLTQLLQQIFGTAEGYRRCNPSIIGPWWKTRHRIFHPLELRLETRFETPEFTLVEDNSIGPWDPVVNEKPQPVFLIDGESRSRELTYASNKDNAQPNRFWEKTLSRFSIDGGGISDASKGNSIPMAVGWLSFLEKLHEHEGAYKHLESKDKRDPRLNPYLRLKPGLRRIQRSWDFMPAEVLRPLASVRFGDLLILCWRMRIRWYDLQLGHKSLRAEGKGHSFTSIDIRGLGFVLEYQFAASNATSDPKYQANGHFAPSKEADMLAFGLIPACKDLGIIQPFDLGGERYASSILGMYERLGVESAILDDFRKNQSVTPADVYYHVANEALYMLAPFIPIETLGAVKIQMPFRHRFGSLSTWREGRLVFLNRLRTIVNAQPDTVSVQLQLVMGVLHDLATDTYTSQGFNHPSGFTHRIFIKNAHDDEARACLKKLHEKFNDTTKYFQENLLSAYTDLVASHLEMALDAHKEAKAKKAEAQRNGTGRNGMTTWMSEAANLYVDNVNTVYQSMQKRQDARRKAMVDGDASGELLPNRSTIVDAWWTLMLRAILWNLSVHPIQNPGLPMRSNLYGDTTLVWIA